ncbi:MAG: radical SAM protein [Allobaculum sp.]|nr:radical SAM protein [Allobaculum sp.]
MPQNLPDASANRFVYMLSLWDEHGFYDRNALFFFDPYRVKLFFRDSNALFPLPVREGGTGDHARDPAELELTCSKVRNQITHQHEKNFRFNTPRNLRIVLGHACNFRCKYCAQKHEPRFVPLKIHLEEFMTRLDRNLLYDELQLVQFWGGEPLLYWDAIKWLMKEFKKRFKISGAGFSMATNGSMLTWDITKDILEEPDFGFILSHDGPGQKLRGPDPLDPKKESGKCLRILARAKSAHNDRKFANQGRNFAVNPVITSATKSLLELVDWYYDAFGIHVPIAECIPMIPIQPGTEPYAPWPLEYEDRMFMELMHLGIQRFDNYRLLYELFIQKLNTEDFTVNPTKATCFTTDPYMLTVDLDGNILPCQTYDASERTMPDGSPCISGKLYLDMNDSVNNRQVKLDCEFPPLHNWASGWNKDCATCEVLSFCMGGCPYLTGEAGKIDCKSKKMHFRALFRVFLSKLFKTKVMVEPVGVMFPRTQ